MREPAVQIERCVVFSIKAQNSDEPMLIKTVANILPQKWSYFKFNVITRIFGSCQGNLNLENYRILIAA